MCGQLIDAVNAGQRVFFAVEAYECLISVPFHAPMALRFIDYYNTTMQFHSTLNHLRSPPDGYQQPAFDLPKGLEDLKHDVQAGVFNNQYDFEAALQHLVYSMHDAHVDLHAGVLSAFSFASPFPLVTASLDGKETPKIYFADDVIKRRDNTNATAISAITHINGEPVIQYLTNFAALQAFGMVEPHADWNQLMDSPVQDILGGASSIFSGATTFYPGNSLNFTFEDASKPVEKTSWLAIYKNTDFTGPLTTGGDFYNFFVLGLLPSSYKDVPLPPSFGGTPIDDSPDAVNTTLPTDGTNTNNTQVQTSWEFDSYGAFPSNPDIAQLNLGLDGGVITGYFYNDISTGVISIPHFDQYGWDIGNFSQSLADFIHEAKTRNLTHIIVDIQKNYGGSTGIALLLFGELFPAIDPVVQSQRRSHELGNVLGSATTSIYQELANSTEEYEDITLALTADEWVITTRLNAETGRNFTSWEEYEGPRQQHGDDFSLVEKYDLKNPTFQAAAFDGWVFSSLLDENETAREANWDPENVVILTDGTCSSACAMFLELATTQAGARTVVVGGAPSPGPMQAASGSRGVRSYSNIDLDVDFSWVGDLDETAKARLPATRTDTGMYVIYAGLNLRDQLRADDLTMPLQFRYMAAECRLYFTLDNVYNMSALWHDVAHAAFQDSSLCVEGSTGYASRRGTKPSNPPPKSSAVAVPGPKPAATFTVDYDPLSNEGLPAGMDQFDLHQRWHAPTSKAGLLWESA
ncbi:peptidase S41 family protein [Colletotrichum karsti]|uniref:Peptidase S41 family protein n=1 Tax=Colletotrichum karsti TaxID=1095194 RepID=A0A9P6IDG2_9PEZI|nr:peptidase S41 family protein [Colletotrichum karsti]KAF9880434.1 peptidase S41 family protein [Colletotrichum karsti]